jgi:hypothetical protein
MPLLLGEILDMAVARFLQISDLHLGAPLGWLPPERRTERRRDQRQALERVVSEAIERGVNGILVAGDLFDQEGVDADSLAFALHAFKVAGCPPVFISPGNHDPFSNTSVYWSPRLLKARGFAWPDHVHVFTTTEWSRKAVPGLEGVNVWGRCFTPSVESAERPLAAAAMAKIAPEAKEGLHIGLFHGSREGKCPPGQKRILSRINLKMRTVHPLRSRLRCMLNVVPLPTSLSTSIHPPMDSTCVLVINNPIPLASGLP